MAKASSRVRVVRVDGDIHDRTEAIIQQLPPGSRPAKEKFINFVLRDALDRFENGEAVTVKLSVNPGGCA